MNERVLNINMDFVVPPPFFLYLHIPLAFATTTTLVITLLLIHVDNVNHEGFFRPFCHGRNCYIGPSDCAHTQ